LRSFTKLVLLVLLIPALAWGGQWQGSQWRGGLWAGSIWKSSQGYGDYALYLDTARYGTKDMVSRNSLTATIAGARTLADGTAVVVNQAAIEAVGVRTAPVVSNLITGTAPVDLTIDGWLKTRATVSPSAAAAPFGGGFAYKVIASSDASTTHKIFSPIFIVNSGGSYCASIYVKASEYDYVSIAIKSSIESEIGFPTPVIFNLLAGTVSGSGEIVPVADDWYRIIVTGAANSTTDARLVLYLCDNIGNTVFTGDGESGIYAWGAQVTASAYPLPLNTSGSAWATEMGGDDAGVYLDDIDTNFPDLYAALGGDGVSLGGDVAGDLTAWIVSGGDANNYLSALGGGVYRLVADGTVAFNIKKQILISSKYYRHTLTVLTSFGQAGVKLNQDGDSDCGSLPGVGLSVVDNSGTDTYLEIFRQTAGKTTDVTFTLTTKPIQAQGSLRFGWTPGWDKADISGENNILKCGDFVVQYDADNGLIELSDGTNTASVAYDAVQDTQVWLHAQWLTDTMRVGYSTTKTGEVTWGSDATFAGTFTPVTQLNLSHTASHLQWIGPDITVTKEVTAW
jgi:hypothetical protein